MDYELYSKIKKGNLSVLRDLQKSELPWAYFVCYRMTKDVQTAAELLRKAWTETISTVLSLGECPDDSFRVCLARILYRLCDTVPETEDDDIFSSFEIPQIDEKFNFFIEEIDRRVDTAINSGNSGGGLYDDEGNLIGIVNAKFVYDGVENIAYAIPSNVAVSIAENIIDYCYGTDTERVQRALLGITVIITDSKAFFDTSTGLIRIEETVAVYEVSQNSLADGVLEADDIFVSATIDGKTSNITRQYHIIDMLLDLRVGDVVTLTVLRDGEEVNLSITITEDCLTAY